MPFIFLIFCSIYSYSAYFIRFIDFFVISEFFLIFIQKKTLIFILSWSVPLRYEHCFSIMLFKYFPSFWFYLFLILILFILFLTNLFLFFWFFPHSDFYLFRVLLLYFCFDQSLSLFCFFPHSDFYLILVPCILFLTNLFLLFWFLSFSDSDSLTDHPGHRRARVDANAQAQPFRGQMRDGEGGQVAHEGQGHVGNVPRMLVPVAVGQARHAQVPIAWQWWVIMITDKYGYQML